MFCLVSRISRSVSCVSHPVLRPVPTKKPNNSNSAFSCAVGFVSGPLTGLLGPVAAFACCVAPAFWCSWTFSGPVPGLLGRDAAFREAGLSSRTSNLFVVCGCLLLVKIDFFQGLSPACLVGLLLFVKCFVSCLLRGFLFW